MKQPIKPALSLLIFTVICIFLVQLTHQSTKDGIEKNIEQALLNQLNKLVSDYDNDIVSDKFAQTVILHKFAQTIDIYPAKKNGKTNAYLIKHIYPRGYGGDITLLSAVSIKGKLIGVRVVSHQETPGLGDGIDDNKSDWILQLSHLWLGNHQTQWQLKSKGGQFDQLSGATISSMALINASYELLTYLKQNPISSKHSAE